MKFESKKLFGVHPKVLMDGKKHIVTSHQYTWVDEVPIAFISATETLDHDVMDIESVLVLPRHRGKGKAQQALKEFLLLKKHVKEIYSWPSGELPEHLLEKVGFKSTGDGTGRMKLER